MATINGSTNSSQWTFKLEATEIAYSIPNKNSTVRVQVYLGRASSQSYLGGNYNLSVKCADQTQNANGNIPYPTYINGGSWYLLKTFTFTVSNTGNPTTISISSTMSSSDFNPSSASASGSLTLTKLHDAPNITSFSLTEKNTQLTNLSVPNSTIVQYLSNKTATINVSTYDNATITNYSVYHNNVLIGSSTSNTITINFANIGELIDSGTGKVGLMVAVTDSLGGYSTKMFDFTVIKYTRPNIEKTSTTIKRKTGNGTVLTDNKVLLNFVGTCYKGNDVIGNANKPTVQYKIWNTTEPNYSTLTTPNTSNVTIKDYEISNILYTSTYNYKIKIYDVFTTTETTINLKVDKVPTGVSVWTEYKDRVDYEKITIKKEEIVEINENENSSYIKYYNGLMICNIKIPFSKNADWEQDQTTFISNYEGIEFPTKFISIENVQISVETTSTGRYVWSSYYGVTNAGINKVSIMTYWNASNTTGNIHIMVIGKWK